MDGMNSLENDPQASDNRLALNPHSFLDGEMDQWKDGTVYVLDGVRVRQSSSGEFEVLGISSGKPEADNEGATETNAEAAPAEASEQPPGGEPGSDYPNPAVARMMRGRRA